MVSGGEICSVAQSLKERVGFGFVQNRSLAESWFRPTAEAPLDRIHWTTTGPADEPKFTAIRALPPSQQESNHLLVSISAPAPSLLILAISLPKPGSKL
jgi:hypothetical protein